MELEQMWQEYDLVMLEQKLEQLFPGFSLDFEGLLEELLKGNVVGAFSQAISSAMGGMGEQLLGLKETMVWLMVLGIGAAMISHFVSVFENHQIADLSFYFVYLLFTTVLLRCFQECADVTVQAVEDLLSFIKLFVPTYVLSVGVSTGTTTATAYYGLLLLLIYFVQKVLLVLVIPCIYSYVFLSVINGVWTEQKLGLLADLTGRLIRLLLKLSLGAVTGINIFQSLITPVIDSAKTTALQKTVSALPGVGNLADGVVDVVLGSAVIIKNAIGVVMLILLLAVCAAPFLKILAISLLLRLTAALLGVVSDKRITACTNKIGEGSELLLQTAGTAMALFLLTISVTAFATNRGF